MKWMNVKETKHSNVMQVIYPIEYYNIEYNISNIEYYKKNYMFLKEIFVPVQIWSYQTIFEQIFGWISEQITSLNIPQKDWILNIQHILK